MTITQIFVALHSGDVCIGEKFISPEGLIVEIIDDRNVRVSQAGEEHIWEAPDVLRFLKPPIGCK